MTFGTANGRTDADEALPMQVSAFGDLRASPFIFKSTPAALSIGPLCMHVANPYKSIRVLQNVGASNLKSVM